MKRHKNNDYAEKKDLKYARRNKLDFHFDGKSSVYIAFSFHRTVAGMRQPNKKHQRTKSKRLRNELNRRRRVLSDELENISPVRIFRIESKN